MKVKRSIFSLHSIIIILLSLSSIGCNSIEYRVQEPIKGQEINQSLVGFVVFDDLKFDSKDPNSPSLEFHTIMPRDYVIFDFQTKQPESSVVLDKKNPKFVEEDGEKVSYGKSLDLTGEAAFLIDSKKEYYLGYLQWERFCNFCNNPVRAKLSLEPQKSFSTLKIKGKPGEIVFLGVYTVAMKREKKETTLGSFFSLSSDSPNIISEFDRIQPDSPIWKKEFNLFASYIFDNEHGFSERSAEIAFLKKVIEAQKKGYWKELAEKRLREILVTKN